MFSGGTGAIISTSGITSIQMSAPSGYAVLLYEGVFGASTLQQTDDPAPSSEAATFALVGGGMLVFFGVGRKFVRRIAV
jgi:hypothetical protein